MTKKVCTEYKKLNRDERRGQKRLDFDGSGKPWERMGNAAVLLASLDSMGDDSLDAVRSKEERYAQLVGSADYLFGRFWADSRQGGGIEKNGGLGGPSFRVIEGRTLSLNADEETAPSREGKRDVPIRH